MNQQEKFWNLIKNYETHFTSWRYGQILFNALFDVNPELANEIRASDLDPFFETERNSKKITKFIEFVTKRL